MSEPKYKKYGITEGELHYADKIILDGEVFKDNGYPEPRVLTCTMKRGKITVERSYAEEEEFIKLMTRGRKNKKKCLEKLS